MKSETVQNQMNHLSLDDSTSELRKKINDSMVIMDSNDNSDSVHEKKVRKSITLNLEAQPPTPTSKYLNPNQTPKGILKKTENNVAHETGRDYYQKVQEKRSTAKPRPHNLEELIDIEGLVSSAINNTFTLEELSDDDEIWLMDMPKRIKPDILRRQILSLTDKTKLKVGKERYTAIHREVKGVLTCVFSNAKGSLPNTIVNLKPSGMIQLRQKLTTIPKTKPECTKKTKIPLPQNIRHRDPFHGVVKKGNNYADVPKIKIEVDSRTER